MEDQKKKKNKKMPSNDVALFSLQAAKQQDEN